MCQGDIPNRIEALLNPRRVRPGGEAGEREGQVGGGGLKNLRLAPSHSMIVSSAGVIWVCGYRVISEATRNGQRRNYFPRQTASR